MQLGLTWPLRRLLRTSVPCGESLPRGYCKESLRSSQSNHSSQASMLRTADFGIKSLACSPKSNSVDAVHQVQDENGRLIPFTLSMMEESDGTNSYFNLVGVVQKTLNQGGGASRRLLICSLYMIFLFVRARMNSLLLFMLNFLTAYNNGGAILT